MGSYIEDWQVEASVNDVASLLETAKGGYEVIEVEVEASNWSLSRIQILNPKGTTNYVLFRSCSQNGMS